MENMPLVKFMQNYIWDPSSIIIFHILTNDTIGDVIFQFFTAVLHVETVCLNDKKKNITLYTVAWTYEFYFHMLKQYFTHSYCFYH